MARIRDGSRYTNSFFTRDVNGREFLLLRKTISIAESSKDVYITVEDRFQKRPDLISQQAYGRPDLGWIIMDINNIIQPLFTLTTGTSLRIPPLGEVLEAIENLNK